ncbi:hypothetical protein H7J06_02675 [Mycobacterium hodleri]|uniref:hypothetical protein n=1 Tax=Mycolicibacterium hodleri TaxID=49897 RepID=UPI0021F2AF70|nr:hypothetical protein [Mycolicibacterium hodleri]MCV7131879.1 hypothetical protein [Mycolicibacterium hodleri]
MRTHTIVGAAIIVATAVVTAGCGTGGTGGTSGTAPPGSASLSSSTAAAAASESNPAGDIPDTQAFVAFTPPGGLFTVSVPEGWARSTDGAATVFTDKLNAVRIETRALATAPNTMSVGVDELPAIAASTPGYRPGTVTAVTRKAGPVMLITYQGTSSPNPVTGKAGTDAIERYEFWRDGHEVILTLSGPVGADNVDPWRTVTDSLQWQ